MGWSGVDRLKRVLSQVEMNIWIRVWEKETPGRYGKRDGRNEAQRDLLPCERIDLSALFPSDVALAWT